MIKLPQSMSIESYKEKVKARLIDGKFKKEKERLISEAVRDLDCEIENVKDEIKKKANHSDKWFVELKFDTLIELKIEEIKLLKSWIDDSGYSFKESQLVEENTENQKEDYKEAWKIMLKAYGKFSSHNINNFIVDELKLTVCPYCNRNYVNNLSKNKASAQLDHFIDKSTYPIFALSIYNLIPCCQPCNHSKANREVKGSPYDVGANNENIRFSYNPISANYVNDKDDLEVIVKAIDEKYVSNISALKLEKAYEIHKKDVLELINKHMIYNDLMIEGIISTFEGLFENENEMKGFIYGINVDDESYDRPLSKLRKDILDELEE